MSSRGTNKHGATPVQESTPSRILSNTHFLDKEEENHVSDEVDDTDVGDRDLEDVKVDFSGEGERDDDNDSDSEGEDDDIELNSAILLKEGIIKTKESQKELTVLLVGETGVGKTTILSFIGNVLKGSMVGDYVNVYDVENEATGSEKGSKTNEPRLYIHTSKNDVVLRVLDTPGLADTRGLDYDNQHKENIAKAIRENITTVDAVLIVANGTVPRLTVAADYTLSVISSIFPRSLAENIAFIFTNVLTRASLNVTRDSLPPVLRHAEQFLFDNPVALQKKHKELQVDLEQQRQQIIDERGRLEQMLEQTQKQKRLQQQLERLKDKQNRLEVEWDQYENQLKRMEEFALDTLANLFDWINRCEAQPTKDILLLYEQAQTIDQNIGNALAAMDDAAKERERLQQLKADIEVGKIKVGKLNNFETLVKSKGHVQDPQDHFNVLCCMPGCYSNCHERCPDRHLLPPGGLRCETVGSEDCKICGHPIRHHQRCKATWREMEVTKWLVDPEKEKRYLVAKGELLEKEAAESKLQMRINELTKEIDGAMGRITHTAEEYAKLSLSRSFSGQIEKSIALLTLSLEVIRNANPRREVVDALEKIVRDLEQRLEIFREAARARVLVTPTLSNVGFLVEDTSTTWVRSM